MRNVLPIKKVKNNAFWVLQSILKCDILYTDRKYIKGDEKMPIYKIIVHYQNSEYSQITSDISQRRIEEFLRYCPVGFMNIEIKQVR